MTDAATDITTTMPPAVGADGGHMAGLSASDRAAAQARQSQSSSDPTPEQAEFMRIHGLSEITGTGAERAKDSDAAQELPQHDAPAHNYELPASIASDKFVADFAGAMAEKGLPQETMSVVAEWYADHTKQVQADFAALDDNHIHQAAVKLQGMWGAQAAANAKAINQFLDGDLPPGVGDALRNTRLPNGMALGNDPATLQWLLGLACGPKAMPTPRTAGGKEPQVPTGDIDMQIAEIENIMRTDRWKYSRDEGMQQRYRELLAARHGV